MSESEFAKATREAELGFCTCRICKEKSLFTDCITALYGGGLVFALCMPCAEKGHEILIRREGEVIRVYNRINNSVLSIGYPNLNVLKRNICG